MKTVNADRVFYQIRALPPKTAAFPPKDEKETKPRTIVFSGISANSWLLPIGISQKDLLERRQRDKNVKEVKTFLKVKDVVKDKGGESKQQINENDTNTVQDEDRRNAHGNSSGSKEDEESEKENEPSKPEHKSESGKPCLMTSTEFDHLWARVPKRPKSTGSVYIVRHRQLPEGIGKYEYLQGRHLPARSAQNDKNPPGNDPDLGEGHDLRQNGEGHDLRQSQGRVQGNVKPRPYTAPGRRYYGRHRVDRINLAQAWRPVSQASLRNGAGKSQDIDSSIDLVVTSLDIHGDTDHQQNTNEKVKTSGLTKSKSAGSRHADYNRESTDTIEGIKRSFLRRAKSAPPNVRGNLSSADHHESLSCSRGPSLYWRAKSSYHKKLMAFGPEGEGGDPHEPTTGFRGSFWRPLMVPEDGGHMMQHSSGCPYKCKGCFKACLVSQDYLEKARAEKLLREKRDRRSAEGIHRINWAKYKSKDHHKIVNTALARSQPLYKMVHGVKDTIEEEKTNSDEGKTENAVNSDQMENMNVTVSDKIEKENVNQHDHELQSSSKIKTADSTEDTGNTNQFSPTFSSTQRSSQNKTAEAENTEGTEIVNPVSPAAPSAQLIMSGRRSRVNRLLESTRDSMDNTSDFMASAAEPKDSIADFENSTAGYNGSGGSPKDSRASSKDSIADSEHGTADSKDRTDNFKDSTAGSMCSTDGSEDNTVDSKDSKADSKDDAVVSKDSIAGSGDGTTNYKDDTKDSHAGSAVSPATSSKVSRGRSKDSRASSMDSRANSKHSRVSGKDTPASSKDSCASSKTTVSRESSKATASRESSKNNRTCSEDSIADSKDGPASSKHGIADSDSTADSDNSTLADVMSDLELTSDGEDNQKGFTRACCKKNVKNTKDSDDDTDESESGPMPKHSKQNASTDIMSDEGQNSDSEDSQKLFSELQRGSSEESIEDTKNTDSDTDESESDHELERSKQNASADVVADLGPNYDSEDNQEELKRANSDESVENTRNTESDTDENESDSMPKHSNQKTRELSSESDASIEADSNESATETEGESSETDGESDDS